MQNLRPSETALKVAYGLLSLSAKSDWQYQLPDGLVDLTETLILEANVLGYNERLLGMSQKRWMVGFYDRVEKLVPGVFKGIGERKLFMDWAVHNAIQNGAEQVLIVGAGFDTLCMRLADQHPEVRFVEVDHPATGKAKARGVEKIGRPNNLTLLQADLGKRSLVEVLSECAGWDSELNSVSVAEGLLYYLDADAVNGLFSAIHTATGEGSSVAFSFMADHRQHGWVSGLLNLLREPWLSSADPEQLGTYIGEEWQVSLPVNPTQYRSDLEEFAVVERAVN